ncbi:MAG: hypothetical protein Tsb0014_01020 [Pleurocapsa sp.]
MKMSDNSFLEITEGEITGQYRHKTNKHSSVRHIAQFESQSHRGLRNSIPKTGMLPKICHLTPAKANEEANLAVNILRYQLSDRAAQETHLESVRRSLEKRLQRAKAQGDRQLISLLEDEFKQLEISVS